MIVSFRDDWLRAFFVDDIRSRNIPSDLESRLFRKLQMIDDAMTDQICACHQAIIQKSCAASWPSFIRSASTSNGGLSSNGMAAEAKRRASISTTIAIREVSDAGDETEACKRRRNSGSGIHGADGTDAGRVGQGHGRAAQACQRAVQQPQGRDRADCAHPCPVFGNSPEFWLNVQ